MHMPPAAATSIQATHSGGRPRAQLVPSVDACALTCGCLRARRRSSIGDECTGAYYMIVLRVQLFENFSAPCGSRAEHDYHANSPLP